VVNVELQHLATALPAERQAKMPPHEALRTGHKNGFHINGGGIWKFAAPGYPASAFEFLLDKIQFEQHGFQFVVA
jgi:hypothetical protein